jgi:predicted extracellular nuclease
VSRPNCLASVCRQCLTALRAGLVHATPIAAALVLAGCAARQIRPGDDLAQFVGDRVTIEGVVADTTAYLPGNSSPQGWCLTLSRHMPTPRNEVSMSSGDAIVVFDTDRKPGSPSAGERVRVTGQLVRAEATVQATPRPTYALKQAKWTLVGE